MTSWGAWARKYLLNIDTIMWIIIAILVIYFIWTRKKKNYKFTGLDYEEESSCNAPPKRKKRVLKHEEECRRIFQDLFNVPFKSVRPGWLKNPATNKNLELDGYNPSIITPLGKGLAFEYDGEQHADYNPHFHRNGPAEFKYQVKKDMWKDKCCKDNGVMLIRIPHYVEFHDMERYIKDELKRNKMNIYVRNLNNTLVNRESANKRNESESESSAGEYDEYIDVPRKNMYS